MNTAVLQEVVARFLTDAHFRTELLERPAEILSQLPLSQEQRETLMAAIKDKQSLRAIVDGLSTDLGTKAAAV